MSYKYLDSRQVKNISALTHIGAPANDTLDDILTKIDTAIAGAGGGGAAPWRAGSLAIGSGTNTVSFTFPQPQPDASYVLLVTLQNTVDATPDNIQIISVAKSASGFTVLLSANTDTANYSVSYIVPIKAFAIGEAAIPSSASSITYTLDVPDNGGNYGLIAYMQNFVDVNPQLQPVVVTAKTGTTFTASWNSPTDSSNYVLAFMKSATAEIALGSGISSKNVTVPVAYGNTNYAVVAMMQNLTDPTPQFQPLIITSKSSTGFTVSWPDPTDSTNYKLVYYAISYA